MEDKELLGKCHDGECICDGCKKRFECWTTTKVFSDPARQAFYEAHLAEGFSHKEASQAVKEVVQLAIKDAAIRDAMIHGTPAHIRDNVKPYDEYKQWNTQWKCDLDDFSTEMKDFTKEIKDLSKLF